MKFVQVLFIVVIAIIQLKEGSSTPTAGSSAEEVAANQKKTEQTRNIRILLHFSYGYLENLDDEVIAERNKIEKDFKVKITIESLNKCKTLILSKSESFEKFRCNWIEDWHSYLDTEIPDHFQQINVKALKQSMGSFDLEKELPPNFPLEDVKVLKHSLKRDAKPESLPDVKEWKKLMEKLAFNTLFTEARQYMILTSWRVDVSYKDDLQKIFENGQCFEFLEILFNRNGHDIEEPKNIIASVDEFKRTYWPEEIKKKLAHRRKI